MVCFVCTYRNIQIGAVQPNVDGGKEVSLLKQQLEVANRKLSLMAKGQGVIDGQPPLQGHGVAVDQAKGGVDTDGEAKMMSPGAKNEK